MRRGYLVAAGMCLAGSVALAQEPAKLPANPVAQTVFYTGKVKIIPPAWWIEKQSWEFGVNVNGSIPLYNRQVEGVAFSYGFENKAELVKHRGAHDVKSLAQPAELLGSHLSAWTYGWSAEASRFHLMVSAAAFRYRSAGRG